MYEGYYFNDESEEEYDENLKSDQTTEIYKRNKK